MTSNDVGAVLRTFGVEAARATLVREVGAVFGAYGIGVDARHLSLISDHMTHQVRAPLPHAHACRRLHVSAGLVGELQILVEMPWLCWELSEANGRACMLASVKGVSLPLMTPALAHLLRTSLSHATRAQRAAGPRQNGGRQACRGPQTVYAPWLVHRC